MIEPFFQGRPHQNFHGGPEAFPDPLYYDVRYDLPERIIR